MARGYEQGSQPFIFLRNVAVNGRPLRVQVDILAGEYGGTGKNRRTQRVQDVQPRRTRGADIAFDQPIEVTISGRLPEGGVDTGNIRVASIVPFLVMKGMALDDRLKEKNS